MGDKFNDLCETVMKFKDSKDVIIRKAVIQIIPALASFDPNEFSASYLNPFMAYILSLVKKEKEKVLLFHSIGKISEAVGTNILPFLEQIILSIKENIGLKGYSF
jgi:FKBP12-rapamycin complex-associated protein